MRLKLRKDSFLKLSNHFWQMTDKRSNHFWQTTDIEFCDPIAFDRRHRRSVLSKVIGLEQFHKLIFSDQVSTMASLIKCVHISWWHLLLSLRVIRQISLLYYIQSQMFVDGCWTEQILQWSLLNNKLLHNYKVNS